MILLDDEGEDEKLSGGGRDDPAIPFEGRELEGRGHKLEGRGRELEGKGREVKCRSLLLCTILEDA